MCEVVFRVMDKAAPDDPRRAVRTSRGCVIDVLPDGWGFSERELTNPEWRIVRFPGLPQEAFADCQQPIYDRDRKLVARRARAVDLDSIPAVESKFRPGQVVELSPSDANAVLAARKDVSTGAAVIG